MRKITHQLFVTFLFLLPLFGLGIRAQVEVGKTYNIVNVKQNQSMAAQSLEKAILVSTNTKDYSQLWYAEEAGGGSFFLRNLGNGMYLRCSNKASAPWNLLEEPTDDKCKLYSVGIGNPVFISSNSQGSGYTCMHYDVGQGCIVSWQSNDEKSKWNLEVVDIGKDALENNWVEIDKIHNAQANLKSYEILLDDIFADKACTVLSPTYAAKTEIEIQSDEKFRSLPPTLQSMVLKVKKDQWDEANEVSTKLPWESDYAKKFRVQLYEPYSDPVESSNALKINLHSNLNNPTGLYANARQALYVMVEGKINPGAELYIGSYSGHGKPVDNFRSGTRLKEGLNIVTSWGNGSAYFINYVVETFKDGKMTTYKLSQFPNLKIHIEGGYINGYFNAVGDELYVADKDADWNYYEQRANLEDITILGKYQTLQFNLHARAQADNPNSISPGLESYFTEEASVEKVIAEWDRIVYSERLTLGMLSKSEVDEANQKYPTLDDKSRGVYSFIGGEENGFYKDYSDSYRLHGLSYSIDRAYMYASSDHSAYNVNTLHSIICEIVDAPGPTWGPAHEIGHQHQRVLNMNGLTEVSNNIFSNVAVWYKGLATSRINGSEGCLNSVLDAYNRENHDFFTNNIWAQTQMYYKLWLYYHLVGHNNKFFPRLFEILRQDPMEISTQQDGAKCLLHFYKKCCLAAKEDLTEFFRAYGFFSPMNNRHVEDYSPAIYNMTQKQIDAAIKEVKSWNFPVNECILFINDGTKDDTFGHDGTTKRTLWDEGGATSDIGNYVDFYLTKESKMTKPYQFTIEGNIVTFSGGEGGVGFLITDMDGNLLAFSDRYSFKISSLARNAFATGRAKVYVINGDNSKKEIKLGDVAQIKKSLLGALLKEVTATIDRADESGTRVGFFLPDSLANLIKAKEEAQMVFDAGDEGAYAAVYTSLFEIYQEVQANSKAKVGIVTGNVYALENKLYPGYYMSIAERNNMIGVQTTTIADAQKWYFEPTDKFGVFAIKNKGTNTYLKNLKTSVPLYADAMTGAVTYQLNDMGNAYFALTCQDNEGKSLHCDAAKNIVGWDAAADGSQWRIVAVEIPLLEKVKKDLATLISQTNDLINECGRIVPSGKLALQTTHAEQNGFLFSNADQNKGGGAVDGGGIAALLDNNTSTYFHSRWGGAVVNEPHYLQVDLGADMPIDDLKFSYATRFVENTGQTSPAPTKMTVQGSADGQNFVKIVDFPKGDSVLPTYKEAGKTWTSEVMKVTNFRYLRLVVTESSGPGNNKYANQYFFAMSEFGLENVGASKVLIDEAYPLVNSDMMLSTYSEMQSAREILNMATTAEPLAEKLAALQMAYNLLLEARNGVSLETCKEQLQTLIDQTLVLLEECKKISAVIGETLIAQVDATLAKAASLIVSSDILGIKQAIVDLQYAYDELYRAFKTYEVGELQNWIDKTSALLEECKQVSTVIGEKLLSTVETSLSSARLLKDGSDVWAIKNAVPEMQNTYEQLYNAFKNYAVQELDVLVETAESLVTKVSQDVLYKGYLKKASEIKALITTANSVMSAPHTVTEIASAKNNLKIACDFLSKACDELLVAYQVLDSYYHGDKIVRQKVVGGDNPGFYSRLSAEAYNLAYTEAGKLLTNQNGTTDLYTSAYEELKSALEGLVMNYPQLGKFYSLRNAHSGYANNHLLYVDTSNRMLHGVVGNKIKSDAIWQFEPTADRQFKLLSFHTGEAVEVYSVNGPTALSLSGAPLAIVSLNYSGQVKLVAADKSVMYAQESQNAVVSGNGDIDSPAAWYIEEVHEPSSIVYDVEVKDHGMVDLYLNFNVEIPEGVTAYVANDVDGRYVNLMSLSTGIIPAKTGVLLKAENGKYEFNYSAVGTAVADSKLRGCLYEQSVRCESNQYYYVFGTTADYSGLFKIKLEGKNSFKVGANKTYLPAEANVDALTPIFDGVTGIDGVNEGEGEWIVYDLQGRRVHKIEKTGIYIVNGKKQYIKMLGI